MIDDYETYGYFILRRFLVEDDIQKLRDIVTKFHQSWIQKNAQLYADMAINSAYLTAKEHLNDAERESLFKFIGSARLMGVVTAVMGDFPAFMNTQLFFDPVNKLQRNYWHRDSQYHLSIEGTEGSTARSECHPFPYSLGRRTGPGVDTWNP